MFAKALLGILGISAILFGAAGIVVFQSGILIVDVDQKTEGHHIYVPVPMLLADFGLSFVPPSAFKNVQRELGPHKEIIQALSREMVNCPDATFVEVQTSRENVKISKEDDSLIVNVVTPDENVHIEVPISSTDRILNKIANRPL